MSLINEALKKAQRQRGDQAPASDGGATGPIEKRGKPMRAQSLLLLAAAAAVLIAFSVVVTVYLVNRQPPHLASATPPAPKQIIRSEPADEPTPIVVAPILPPPAPATPIAPSPRVEAAPPPVAAKPAEKRLPPAQPVAAPIAEPSSIVAKPEPTVAERTPAARRPAAELPAPAPAAAKPAAPGNAPADPRVHAFVDAIRVTGIRSSGNESKVLMNDRVFRVNDVVDRSLELKLVKVESDTLTFVDANGVIYTKNF